MDTARRLMGMAQEYRKDITATAMDTVDSVREISRRIQLALSTDTEPTDTDTTTRTQDNG